MGKIVAKLNLNKTPQNVEDNSLVFAKNIRLLKDGSIAPDIAWKEIMYEGLPTKSDGIKGYIVGVDNKVYLFVERIVSNQSKVDILEYDEIGETFRKIDCGWKYSGGKITGYTTINNTNEVILTICEYFENENSNIKVPIKHINLSRCSSNDDESIYTQAPNIPITNLTLVGTYTKNIPNGVYQFFIRYKIRENFYTNWFPCSKECFSGTHIKTNTIKGTLRYIDTNKDSSNSFVFSVEHLLEENISNYIDYQIGFIVSNDDTTVARSWKSFSFDTTTIYFDYEQAAIENVDIDEMTKATYELFNVRNLTYFRNKLYISNYEETDFNPDLRSAADNVNIELTYANPEYSEVDDNVNITVIVGDKQLGKTDNQLDYYDTWGGSPIKQIAKNNNFTRFNYSQSGSNIKNYTETIKCHLKYDEHISPDLIWVNKIDIGPSGDDTKVIDNTKSKITTLKYTAAYPDDYTRESPVKGLFTWYDNRNVKDFLGHPFSYSKDLRYKWYLASPSNKQGVDAHNGHSGKFYIYNNGFGTPTKCRNSIIDWFDNLLKSSKNNTFPNKVIHSVYIMHNNQRVYLYGEDLADETSNFKGIGIFGKESADDAINSYIEDIIINSIIGIKRTGSTLSYVVKINDVVYTTDYFNIECSSYRYRTDTSGITVTGDSIATNVGGYVTIETERTQKNLRISASIFAKIIENTTVDYADVQYNSLMPFTGYEFYIHYVKSNGVSTNGYIIKNNTNNIFTFNNMSSSMYNTRNKPVVIYPKISNVQIPNGYVGYFISIAKVGDDVAKLFGNELLDTGQNDGVFVANCLEADTLLYNITDNIDIIDNQGNIVGTGIYYPSGTTEKNKLNYFGDVGVIEWKMTDYDEDVTYGDDYWIKINNKIIKDTNKRLVKLTPYIINDNTIEDYNLLNIPSYLTMVYKLLSHNEGNTLYCAGSDLYNLTIDDYSLKLTDYEDYSAVRDSYKYYVLSNFNFNYLSITEELIPKVRSYTNNSVSIREFMVATQSLTDSTIYELKSMYRDYVRKYYNIYKDDYITKFDNTIRSSDTNIDEAYRNIYKFEGTDYYNIPTNKGKIVNLFSVINNIYVHTEHSFFKFTGTSNIQTIEGDIALKEGDVFDNGIAEIFDSQYGYAGIQKKEHSLVTFDNYIFYDALASTIYIFGGTTQLVPISDPIKKLFSAYNITDVLFVADTQNDRFFINLKTDVVISTTLDSNGRAQNVYGNICLSYNYKANSIISIHDIDFDIAFNTRSRCYMGRQFVFGYSIHTDKQKEHNDYRRLYKPSVLLITDMTYPLPLPSTYIYAEGQDDYEVENCVDVVCNINYETIKYLNHINWICSSILGYATSLYVGEEELNTKYGGSAIRIYSDQCSTELIRIVDSNGNPKVSNDYSISDANSYKYPRFNCGIWSMNYFRDIRTDNDAFHYETDGRNRDKSLIYGKYFIVRLIFKGKNFKLENIKFNIGSYEKV